MNDEDKYAARAQRLLTRWSGQRMPVQRRQTEEGEVLRQNPPALGELAADAQTCLLYTSDAADDREV